MSMMEDRKKPEQRREGDAQGPSMGGMSDAGGDSGKGKEGLKSDVNELKPPKEFSRHDLQREHAPKRPEEK